MTLPKALLRVLLNWYMVEFGMKPIDAIRAATTQAAELLGVAGRTGVVEEMFAIFELLVAPRGGAYQPPPDLRERIRSLDIRGEYEHISSSEVRKRIALGEPWEHLVPEAIAERVREIYS